jgi:mRNA interferase MazF
MKQGNVWLINLDPTIGSEIKKIRPAIIVNDDSFGKLPLRVIVPITEWKDRYDIAPWMIKIEPNSKNGLSKESSADCFQVRSISQERFIKRLGSISEIIMSEIKIGLSKVLSIEN